MAMYITHVPPEIESQAEMLSAAIEKALAGQGEEDIEALRQALKNYGVRMFTIGYVNGIKRRN